MQRPEADDRDATPGVSRRSVLGGGLGALGLLSLPGAVLERVGSTGPD